MATENGRNDDKYWLYGGDSQYYNRMKEMFEGVFLRQGGRSLCGHFTGLYSNGIIAQKIVELAPYERELDEDDQEEREVQWNARQISNLLMVACHYSQRTSMQRSATC